ncbi:MAG: hypothetical protein CYPHOPRED_001493 [Cyphobasidiales sp. Tagirdzhanova-0007]|nr:MAG: hypothetical protein CYPHOPRED_001493 [Cyphobasidiales sp. Tagirdzhanova-0007]
MARPAEETLKDNGVDVRNREDDEVWGRKAKAAGQRPRVVITTAKPPFFLANFTFIMLALAMVQSSQASSMTCASDKDCLMRGTGRCVRNASSEKSCGYYGASATYADCVKCPNGMTSLVGKAFYSADCFLPCGDDRCYKPEDGYAECTIAASTASHVCLQTCNQDGYIVLNSAKPYATCVSASNATSAGTLANLQILRSRMALPTATAKRVSKRSASKRLRAAADLHHGPAVAMLEHAGEDSLALISK